MRFAPLSLGLFPPLALPLTTSLLTFGAIFLASLETLSDHGTDSVVPIARVIFMQKLA